MYKHLGNIQKTLLVYLTNKIALTIIRIIRKPTLFQYSNPHLKNMSTYLLGKYLVNLLKKNKLS